MQRTALDWFFLVWMYGGGLLLTLLAVRMIWLGGHRGPWGAERRSHPRPAAPHRYR